MKYWLSHLPCEVWVDVFRCPGKSRIELGRIVDRFSNRKFVEYLQFYLHDWGKRTLNGVDFKPDGPEVFVPYNKPCFLHPEIPTTPMPDNIKSFRLIRIRHFDAQTLDFLHQIRAILSDVNLKLVSNDIEDLRIVLANLAPLVDAFHSLHCCYVCELPIVVECFGNEQLGKLKMLEIGHFEKDREGMLGKAEQQTTISFLMNWLTMPDSIWPKWCKLGIYNDNGFSAQICAAIREEFLTAKSPCTFAVSVHPVHMELGFADFHLQNGIGEELHGVHTEHESDHTGQIGAAYDHQIQIIRHKANCGSALQEWVKESTEKMRGGRIIHIAYPTVGLLDAIDPPENEDKEQKPSTSKDA